MLNYIRKTADNIVFRVILGVIVLAFCIWGVKDMLGSGRNFTLVSFKNAEDIKNDEFLMAQYKQVMQIQKANNITLSEEQIREYGIGNMVLNHMITQRLLAVLIKNYDMDFGIKTLSSMIRHMPAFHDKDGKFSSEIFESYLASSGISEEAYVKDLKNKLSQNILLKEFASSYYVPKVVTNNIVDFLSEERVVDLAYIDVYSEKHGKLMEPQDSEIESFYKEHSEEFALPEKRNISYFIVGLDRVRPLVKLTDAEVKVFFEENKDEMKSISEARKILIVKKSEELMLELVKNLEDEIAGGSSMEEIAQKFDLKILKASDVTMLSLLDLADIGFLVQNIFSMEEGEISYPMELADNSKLAVVSVDKVTMQSVPSLSDIKSDVVKAWKRDQCKALNLKTMENFIDNVTAENFRSMASDMNLSFNSSVNIKRTDIDGNNLLTPDMLLGIFKSRKDNIIGIYQDDKNYYAIFVKSINHNKVTKRDIEKNSIQNIEEKLKEGVIEEMLFYLRGIENPKIHKSFMGQDIPK